MQTEADYTAWVDANPLRRFRKARRWSIMRTAQSLGVSMTVVQMWERGVHVPNDENLGRIVALVGPNAVQAWNRWYARRPQPVGLG